MQRRSFLTLLGGAAAAWPVAAGAQQAAMPAIGFLNASSRELTRHLVSAFHQGLGEAGFVEGRNVAILYRFAEDQNNRLPGLAADLVRRGVKVIAATGTAVYSAKAATNTIPIIFQTATDPVAQGLVTSLNRPGGNLTGVVTLATEVGPKRLELLHEMIPAATSFALLINPTSNSATSSTELLQAAARTRGLQLHVLHASSERDLDTAFATIGRLRPGGLVLGITPFLTNRPDLLAALTLRHAVPAVSAWREFAAAGGLMSYGSNVADHLRLIGAYTGRILKGEKPADLPVQQATRIELAINMRTAKVLGLTFPITLLGRADEVIE